MSKTLNSETIADLNKAASKFKETIPHSDIKAMTEKLCTEFEKCIKGTDTTHAEKREITSSMILTAARLSGDGCVTESNNRMTSSTIVADINSIAAITNTVLHNTKREHISSDTLIHAFQINATTASKLSNGEIYAPILAASKKAHFLNKKLSNLSEYKLKQRPKITVNR